MNNLFEIEELELQLAPTPTLQELGELLWGALVATGGLLSGT